MTSPASTCKMEKQIGAFSRQITGPRCPFYDSIDNGRKPIDFPSAWLALLLLFACWAVGTCKLFLIFFSMEMRKIAGAVGRRVENSMKSQRGTTLAPYLLADVRTQAEELFGVRIRGWVVRGGEPTFTSGLPPRTHRLFNKYASIGDFGFGYATTRVSGFMANACTQEAQITFVLLLHN